MSTRGFNENLFFPREGRFDRGWDVDGYSRSAVDIGQKWRLFEDAAKFPHSYARRKIDISFYFLKLINKGCYVVILFNNWYEKNLSFNLHVLNLELIKFKYTRYGKKKIKYSS